MPLNVYEKLQLKEQLKGFIKRCTSNPKELVSADRPSPAEISVLPEIVSILIEMD